MAVTHDDLAPSRRGMDLRSRTGAVLIIISVVFGLICFIFSLIAEATRSQVPIIFTTLYANNREIWFRQGRVYADLTPAPRNT